MNTTTKTSDDIYSRISNLSTPSQSRPYKGGNKHEQINQYVQRALMQSSFESTQD
jgi:hypothetical protein